ncbi:GH92 family glycosyl hydrolase [Mucilaginibacter sp. ZT4R22]|uniref:GH92 family glycosyl hydrolase n=1 Tax=Mucilaginibacter pankratovii TaxID=2772110 RepID=A0ABR7WUY7_9SPHI|nr:GH92 family glycosyl hydrolase [Mucilaginibacter pankratovii]MBD1366113.1 GH92 family glycosyl hydrolase [Mucilaginibacter pankratovii]
MLKLFAARVLFIITATLMWFFNADAQQGNHLQYVNPLIGTTKSNVITKWGNNGGTYPGAVAPSGALQLSPETRVTGAKGYDYADSAIYYFSCFGHMSGFPEGSAGRFWVMPVAVEGLFEAGKSSRHFSHQEETATPGYYKVTFNDNHTTAEATVTARAGLFRFTFTDGQAPQLFIGDAGEMSTPSKSVVRASNRNTVTNFSEAYQDKKQVKGGWLFTFKPNLKVIVMKMSTSSISLEGAQKNIDREIGSLNFDEIRQRTRNNWMKVLAVADVADKNTQHKTSFYTALYHSLLIPWVIDDVDGRYKGADGLVHQKSGNNQYGGFSPWDTFRSLHPLLTLLYPDKQNDVILSMLDIYKQTGHLPTESMTGNHAIPIIVDSYLKGINGFDKQLAYTAMKKSVIEPPFMQPDLEQYNQMGYLPFTRSESVTRTVEYAYDDWALAQFAGKTMSLPSDYARLLKMGYNYRNLFNKDALFMLPRNGNHWKIEPGMSGYKEGDKWVYSYFVPQNTQDLINLNGGAKAFTARLDSALTNNIILFDNETVFHLPYLFNQAGYPALTQKWCRQFMLNRFSATPGGLPGNDDLGSTSSWYVFSALGIYPVCPGRPYYAIGAPIFDKVILHLPNRKNLIIKADNASNSDYVQMVKVNGKPWQQLVLPHATLINGGNINFTMGSHASNWPINKKPQILSETRGAPFFELLNYKVSNNTVLPNQPLMVKFTLLNTGSMGTKKVTVSVNGQAYAFKNCLLKTGQKLTDSIQIRLFAIGNASLQVDQLPTVLVKVKQPDVAASHAYAISSLTALAMVKVNVEQKVSYIIQNIGGVTQTFNIPVMLGKAVLFTDKITLFPGEKKLINHEFTVHDTGFQQLRIDSVTIRFKVYSDAPESLLLDILPGKNTASKNIQDKSGFGNNGMLLPAMSRLPESDTAVLFGNNTYVEVPNSPALDVMDKTITMMAWVKPTSGESGLVDIFTKGDSHVLQVNDGKTLTFFAGGWGRGDCTVPLPANWRNEWHHIAGVCNGKTLYVYIDGVLKGTAVTDEPADLSNKNKWTLGRNEEFPSERVYHGYISKAMVFKEALSAEEITHIYITSK